MRNCPVLIALFMKFLVFLFEKAHGTLGKNLSRQTGGLETYLPLRLFQNPV
jgi:hypothetical protein